MNRPAANRPYKLLAEYYDQRPAAPARPDSADCDLACLALAAKGIKMYVVDLSPAMCRLARAKAPGVALVLHGGYDQARDTGWTNAEWFLRYGSCWRRRRERVEQVCWTPSGIRRTLRAAGFDQVRAWDATPFFKTDPTIRPGCRTFYLAHKSSAKQGNRRKP